MGRPTIPPQFKILTGEKRKERLSPDRPMPAACIPDPPEFLTGDALGEWNRITVELHAVGVLAQMDMAALAGYCQSYADWIGAVKAIQKTGSVIQTRAKKTEAPDGTITTVGGKIQLSPYVRVANEALQMMKGFAVEFGLTPSSRCRVKGVKPKEGEKNKWKELG